MTDWKNVALVKDDALAYPSGRCRYAKRREAFGGNDRCGLVTGLVGDIGEL